MATCGKCKTPGVSVDHVRACYAQGATLAQLAPMHYAVQLGGPLGGKLMFFEVRQVEKGRWAGRKFLNRLLGSPGDWRRERVAPNLAALAIEVIAADPAGCAKRYADEFTCCAACRAPLSDKASRDRGLGPDCAKKSGFTFGAAA